MKRVLLIIGFFVLSYLSYSVFLWIKYGYKIDVQNYKSCYYLFKEFERSKIDTFFFVSSDRNSDNLTHCWYDKDYSISIWNIKSLSSLGIDKVKFEKTNYMPSDENTRWGEELNSNSNPTIFIRYCDFFNTELNIELDEYSIIKERIEHSNYRGFIGRINRLTLRDSDYPYKVHIHYVEGPKEVMVIVFNNGESFYLLMIESKRKLDEKILNIFNLP